MDKKAFELQRYYDLSYYTLAHPDPAFIHQHVVDAQTAQWADQDSKSIAPAFALIGLYLYVEKGYSGKQVQMAHTALAKRRKEWPRFILPESRGDVWASHVLAVPPGQERDEMIRKWCMSVWDAFSESREEVVTLVQSELYPAD